MIIIEGLIGKSFSELKDLDKENIVAINHVNSTIELKNIYSSFDAESPSHALFYFDLADSTIMTMAVIKLERVKYFKKLRIKRMNGISICGYVGAITLFNKGRDVVITYVRENIINAL